MKIADIIVIGAGAAGCMAALIAAKDGAKVVLLERNKTIGRKLAITGGGRCNLTNQAGMPELIENIPGNGRFMYSALQRFGPEHLMEFCRQKLGLELKVERGQRVFPRSDQARDVVEAFHRELQAAGVRLFLQTRVTGLDLHHPDRKVITTDNGEKMEAPVIIVATGGLSYPGTGSTGDGYGWANAAGHTVVPCFPSLVPLETAEDWPARLEGLSLINVRVDCYHQGRLVAGEFGEMLFTRFGVTGPIILSLSRSVVPLVEKAPGSVKLAIDLKPALSADELDQRVQRDFQQFSRKQFKNALDELLPQKLIPVMIDLSGVDPFKEVHQVTRAERLHLVQLLKALQLTVKRPRPMAEAIVTAGGVSTKELDPKTMESKKVPGLFFIGEMVDVDAYTGGFNLQVAFAMGFVAGNEAARQAHQSRYSGEI